MMASLSQLSLVILSLFLLSLSFSSARDHRRHHHYPTKFSAACKASPDPAKCEAALAKSRQYSSSPTPLQAIKSILGLSYRKLKSAESEVNKFTIDQTNLNITSGAKGCLESLANCEYRINLTAMAVPHGRLKDARAWLSAALSYQYGCRSGFQKFVNVTSSNFNVNQTLSLFDALMDLSNNALSMVMNYDIHGNNTNLWSPPKTERDGFWESLVDKSNAYQDPMKNLKANVTVCKTGGCNYKSVQAAVDAAPDNLDSGSKFVIKIKTGVYDEIVRIGLVKRNIVFLGDGMGKTIITGGLNVGMGGITTSETATLGVTGDGFMANNLSIKNTAGSDPQQAVAFRSDSDLSYIQNCEISGHQDTLFAKTLRQYYKSCRILGNVDFIFGNAAAYFQDSLIIISPRTTLNTSEKGAKNAVTAQARTHPAQSTGFVFNNCVINGTEEYMVTYKKNPKVHINYLGRPWREYSRTVFINSVFEQLIAPEGWMPWDKDFALNTLYYGEYNNTGAGSDISRRVNWTNQIPPQHVSIYSPHNFIQADQWLPTIHH